MSCFVFKLIAIFSMLLDHTLKTLPVQQILLNNGMTGQGSYDLIMTLLPLGRFAFPIFAFFIAEGCRHTRRPGNYLLRMLIFGVVSEIPFRLCFSHRSAFDFWPLSLQNVFFTLALGILACHTCDILRKKGHPFLAVLPAFALAVLAELLKTDYGFWGVVIVFTAYVIPRRWGRLLGMGVALSCLYVFSSWNGYEFLVFGSSYYLKLWLFSLIPLPALLLYNGRRGPSLKYVFYAFYPVHLTALYLINFTLFPEFLLSR